MKNQKNVIIKKGRHSRTFLSGIYNACRCQIKGISLLNRCVEDPRYQPSGMTPNLMGFILRPSSSRSVSMRDIGTAPRSFTARSVTPQCRYAGYSGRRGFTLIELLVVVLIIGILAAIAVPQYQKAVAKSRFATIKAAGESLRQAEEVYYLANGAYTGNIEELDISLPHIKDITVTEEKSSIKIAEGQSCTIHNTGLFSCTTSIPGQGNINYETNGIHYFYETDGIHYLSYFAGKRLCVVKSTDETSFHNKFCKAETGATNYAYKDTSKGYMGWIYQ